MKARPVLFSTLSGYGQYHAVYPADLDGDADLDLVVGMVNNGDGLGWFENDLGEVIPWSWHTLDATVYGCKWVVAADMDADEDPDLLAAADVWDLAQDFWEETAWLANTGGAFAKSVVESGSHTDWTAWPADLDGDGDLDVVLGDQGNDEIAWWEDANGDGTVWTAHTVASGFDYVHGVFPFDLEGDGDLDIAAAAYEGDAIAVFENLDGVGGEWVELGIDDAFDGAFSVVAADIDGDGDDDLVGASRDVSLISWWENPTVE